jgi:hypothetical protein
MALLHLLGDRVAVDEEGAQWLLDVEGLWRRGLPRPAPDLHLVVSRYAADDFVPRAEKAATSPDDDQGSAMRWCPWP